jgi:Glycosyltransferase sugar-binding region containing DXD motif
MIPNTIHFVFGMAADFGGRPFGLSHYLAVKSAAVVNNADAVYFHSEFEPTGEWWQKAKPLLTLKQVKAPGNIMGNPLHHVAHKADVVRLQVLKEYGGIYLDLDTICIKPMTDLLHHHCVIGQELKAPYTPKNWRQQIKHRIKKNLGAANNNEITGVANAVLLAEKDSDFINRWLQTYSSFRSKGRDKYWNEHSVIIPSQLAQQHPDKVTLLNPYAFHYPLYTPTGLQQLFEEVHEFPGAYLHHLWDSFSSEKYLSKLTPENIFANDSTYNLIARRFLTH